MKIFLVRHGESEGNVDKRVHKEQADHAIRLSERGHRQAKAVGEFLGSYMQAFNPAHIAEGKLPFRLWTSPYQRTRETSTEILSAIENRTHAVPRWGRHEHILLAEQRFGLFDGLTDEELQEEYPREYAHYKKCEDFEGRFWSALPMGESRFDVATRVHQFFGTIQRDLVNYNIHELVVVAHGTTIRAFVMMWLHLTPEWFEAEPNPKNCSIRLIDGKEDKGYIYAGGGE